MAEEEISLSKALSYQVEKIGSFFAFFKLPLIIAAVGFIALACAIILLLKSSLSASPEVVFSTESTSSAQSKVRVDVEGAVVSPGVYLLEEGSIVQDALSLAGGLSEEADKAWIAKSLNKAAKITDGSKIYIPSANEEKTNRGGAGGTSRRNILGLSADLININTVSSKKLESISGIGPVTAGKIISQRPYSRIEELKSKKIVGEKVYERIKDLLTVY